MILRAFTLAIFCSLAISAQANEMQAREYLKNLDVWLHSFPMSTDPGYWEKMAERASGMYAREHEKWNPELQAQFAQALAHVRMRAENVSQIKKPITITCLPGGVEPLESGKEMATLIEGDKAGVFHIAIGDTGDKGVKMYPIEVSGESQYPVTYALRSEGHQVNVILESQNSARLASGSESAGSIKALGPALSLKEAQKVQQSYLARSFAQMSGQLERSYGLNQRVTERMKGISCESVIKRRADGAGCADERKFPCQLYQDGPAKCTEAQLVFNERIDACAGLEQDRREAEKLVSAFQHIVGKMAKDCGSKMDTQTMMRSERYLRSPFMQPTAPATTN